MSLHTLHLQRASVTLQHGPSTLFLEWRGASMLLDISFSCHQVQDACCTAPLTKPLTGHYRSTSQRGDQGLWGLKRNPDIQGEQECLPITSGHLYHFPIIIMYNIFPVRIETALIQFMHKKSQLVDTLYKVMNL